MKELLLPTKYRKALEELIERFKELYGEGLVSVILYGSAARGEFKDKHSNINLAIILTDASLRNLSKAKKMLSGRSLAAFDVIFFTEDYIRRTQDVFPIEFIDMRENNRVIYGKDVLGSLEIDDKNLRFQCEQELKEKLINLKRRYLATTDKAALTALLFKSVNSTLHVARNILRLKGAAAPSRKEDIINALSSALAVSLDNASRIVSAGRAGARLSSKELDDLFVGFSDELERITETVDRI